VPKRNGIGLNACAGSEVTLVGASDYRAVNFSQLKLSEKQAKALFISNAAAPCMQRRRQRFPTVRMVGEVGNGEVRAKTTNIRACASTAA
jgi:hypothetical protein